ncbi:hypothetical protein JL49_02290 [Pseudoalteromonas luteoviolacea]|nr:hypothetical protein JL49_02290 [Pseudoalteromonas luteoviolacea]
MFFKKTKNIILAGIVFVPTLVNAACDENGCWSVDVEPIYIRSSGINLLQTSGNEEKLTCNAISNLFIQIPDKGNKADLMSVILAAKLSGKKLV